MSLNASGRDDGDASSGRLSHHACRPGVGLAILAVAALVLLAGLLTAIGTPRGHSYFYNMAWFVAFEDAIGQGALYPRHLPALWSGLGGLDFFFYAPLPFYVAAGPARWICQGCDPQTVFALAGGLLWSLSGVAFWAFARRFVAPLAAMAAAAVYMLLPYHIALAWVMRQAVGEFAAYVFLPLIALGMDVAMRDRRMGVSLPIGVAGTLLCHLPTALLAAHVFAAVAIAWAVLHPREALPAIARIGAMAAIGGAMAAIYWLPALALMGDVAVAQLYDEAIFQASNWLFFGASIIPQGNLSAVMLGPIMVAGVVACALAHRTWTTGGWAWRRVVVWILVPIALCIFLNTVLARPIWDNWIISRVQFPFRLLTLVDLSVALAAGFLIFDLQRTRSLRAGWSAAAALAILALSCAIIASPQTRWAIQEGYDRRGDAVSMGGAEEYMPPALRTAVSREVGQPTLSPAEVMAVIVDWTARFGTPESGIEPADRRPREWWFVPRAAGPTVIDVPYWDHMRAETATGDDVVLSPDPDYGLVALRVPEGMPEIRLTLPWQPSEWVGLGLSLAGLAGMALLVWRRMRPG